MRSIRQIFRLWGLYARMDLIWMTRSLQYFLICFFSDAIVAVAGITGVLLLAERFQGLGPWSKPQVVFMLGYAVAVTGLTETFFNYNILYISRRIGRGQMDHVLIQPQPIWMVLLTEGFMPISGSSTFCSGLALMGWAAWRLGLPITPVWLGNAFLHLLVSSMVMLSFSFIWGSLAFWAPRAAEEISTSALDLLNSLKAFPLDGLGSAATWGLLTLVPAGFIAWMPCRSLLGLPSADERITFFAALIFGLLALLLFSMGLKHYGRTGSQRYLPYGHRS